MKWTLILFLLPFCNQLTAQHGDIPSLGALEMSLSKFIIIERDAKLKAFDEVKSSDWYDLLPSVGVAYTPTGKPRPAASWSPLQILDRKEQNKKRKLDRTSITLAYEILLTDRLFKLRQLYHDYQIDEQVWMNEQRIIGIDDELFAITERKYQENLIKPSEYLKAKKQIVQTKADLQKMKQSLLKKRNELLYEAKWN